MNGYCFNAARPAGVLDLCSNPANPFFNSVYCLSNIDADCDGNADVAPPPEPALPATPPADVTRSFWYKGLTGYRSGGEIVTCYDGTRPSLWLSKARNSNGSLISSDKWLFYFPGGGSCFSDDGCLNEYQKNNERDEMTSVGAHNPGAQNQQRYRIWEGIMDASFSQNPTFSAYNRVVVHKYTYDTFNGYAIDSAASSTGPIGTHVRRQMGRGIIRATLLETRDATTYERWDVMTGGMVTETLPALENASKVIFVGTPGGAKGLYYNIDAMAEMLSGWSGFSGEIGAIFDANFMPSLDIESLDYWDGVRVDPVAPVDWSDSLYQSSGGYYDLFVNRYQAKLDKSCEETHGTNHALCLDWHHVLGHHISTAFFVLQDIWDPNPGHCDGASNTFEPDYSQEPATDHVHSCGTPGSAIGAYGDLVNDQAFAIAQGGGISADDTSAGFQSPARHFFLSKCSTHEQIKKADSMLSIIVQGTGGSQVTLDSAISQWSNGLTGTLAGVYGNSYNQVSCP